MVKLGYMFRKQYSYAYDISTAKKVLESIALQHGSNEIVTDDLARTHQFIESAFREYGEQQFLEPVDFAFLIPIRVSRFSKTYWEDTYDFMPALKYVSPHEAYKVVSSLPPCRLEMYGKPGSASSGVLIFVPVLLDMAKDYKNKIRLLRLVRKRINESADFAHKRFGVQYIGLGATLPKLTNYGKTIKSPLVTTTGHAGTTWLIVKTVEQLVTERPQLKRSDITIGFVGGGAIGAASMQVLAKKIPTAKFITYDIRKKVNENNKKMLKKIGIELEIARSNKQLLEQSHLIISAITSKIDVSGVDLVGKIIVDDSQPGSFDKQQVVENGGELVWVVGRDTSKEKFITRRSGYSFGPNGFFDASDLWGCEAEVAAIAYAKKPEFAVKNAVTPRDVEDVGGLLESLGVIVSDYQSYGQLNK